MTWGRRAVLAALLSSTLACAGVEEPPLPRGPVVLVSIDGLRPDALALAAAPNLAALRERGASSLTARTVVPSLTLPSHASMVSGVEPSVHGITWNEFLPDRPTIAVPTIFSVAHARGLRTAFVTGKEKLRHLNAPGTLDAFVLTDGGDAAVANEAVVQIQAAPDVLFVHLPDVDTAGHASGWMSADYLAAVAGADRAVGRIVAALPARATILVTADHGGLGLTHGRDIAEDMTIPWIVAGPDVIARAALTRPVRTMDTAATLLFVLGLPLPAGMTGLPVQEAFAR